MKLGTNQPMGPLQLADFIGADACNLHALVVPEQHCMHCDWLVVGCPLSVLGLSALQTAHQVGMHVLCWMCTRSPL